MSINPASAAITELYNLAGEAFDRRFFVMTANLKSRLLEDFVRAEDGLFEDVEDILNTLSAAAIRTQKSACDVADITDAQKQDFEHRLDNDLANTIIIIRDSFAVFGEHVSENFQRVTATQLGLVTT